MVNLSDCHARVEKDSKVTKFMRKLLTQHSKTDVDIIYHLMFNPSLIIVVVLYLTLRPVSIDSENAAPIERPSMKL